MITVQDLTKHFGQTRAVDGISFEIDTGEVVGFLGPNGAGKTTTIRVLTCFHPATSGRAEVAGFDVFKRPDDVRRNVGYLCENVPLYPDLRVEEFLHYRAMLKGVPRGQRKSAVGAVMERCGVLEVRRKLVGHVSRGYRQRVGLADALVASPSILILDEPTSGLDPNQRRRVKELVRELAIDHTILFSSHILAEVEDVSTRVIVIDEGKIQADGQPKDLLERSEGRRLTVSAALSPSEMAGCLRGITGTRDPVFDSEDAGFSTVSLAVDAGVDPRDEAFDRLTKASARIRELRLDLPSLEEFFTDLTCRESTDDSAPDRETEA
ncbi:MAG: ABC transporter ATP-binding protein [Planctomycetota bacterium]|nr:ABC transporter ATP-binding protein [Planctomycetota bacterium]